jgi:hypothetical protein
MMQKFKNFATNLFLIEMYLYQRDFFSQTLTAKPQKGMPSEQLRNRLGINKYLISQEKESNRYKNF